MFKSTICRQIPLFLFTKVVQIDKDRKNRQTHIPRYTERRRGRSKTADFYCINEVILSTEEYLISYSMVSGLISFFFTQSY